MRFYWFFYVPGFRI